MSRTRALQYVRIAGDEPAIVLCDATHQCGNYTAGERGSVAYQCCASFFRIRTYCA